MLWQPETRCSAKPSAIQAASCVLRSRLIAALTILKPSAEICIWVGGLHVPLGILWNTLGTRLELRPATNAGKNLSTV